MTTISTFLVLKITFPGKTPEEVTLSCRARGAEFTFDQALRLAHKHGWDLRWKTLRDRKVWPARARAYRSPNKEGVGRAGSQLWSFDARRMASI